jgi:hypothetical protein
VFFEEKNPKKYVFPQTFCSFSLICRSSKAQRSPVSRAGSAKGRKRKATKEEEDDDEKEGEPSLEPAAGQAASEETKRVEKYKWKNQLVQYLHGVHFLS